MRRDFAPREIRDILSRMEIVANNEEETAAGKGLLELGCRLRPGRLPVGSFSAAAPILDGGFQSFADEVAVERIGGLEALCARLTYGRERFEGQLLRACAKGIRYTLLVEGGSYQAIREHGYESKMHPNALLGSLFQWQARYGFPILFCQPEESGRLIYATLYYWLKERLETGMAGR